MRVKITFDLIAKPETYERIPRNQVHAFILSRMSNQFAKDQHEKGRLTLFTHGSIRVQYDEDRGSMMFSAPDEITRELIVSLRLNQIFRLGKYHCKLNDIREINDIDTSTGNLLLRGRILLSTGDRKETIRDKETVEKYLADIAERKSLLLGINERLDFDMFDISDTSIYYAKKGNKNIHLPAADIITSVKGTPEALKALLDFGAGQNTGAGAGMMWEVTA